jgi:hypothetical protein
MILPFRIARMDNPIFRTMTNIKMTVPARWKNINPIPIPRLAITRMMHLFRLINQAHRTESMSSEVCFSALLLVLFQVAITGFIIRHI